MMRPRLTRTPHASGHREAITGAVLSSDGSYLLTNSRDHTVRVWDAKPFSSRANRCLKIFAGATHNAENNLIRCDWSPDGAMVCAGSADRNVLVWVSTDSDWTCASLLLNFAPHRRTRPLRRCSTNCRATRASSIRWCFIQRSPLSRRRRRIAAFISASCKSSSKVAGGSVRSARIMADDVVAEYDSSVSSDGDDGDVGAPTVTGDKAAVLDARQLVEASRRKRLYVTRSYRVQHFAVRRVCVALRASRGGAAVMR